MTEWNNTVTVIHNRKGVRSWLRTNITGITPLTQIRVTMRIDDPKKIGWLYVRKALDPAAITAIEVQFPELVGKIT